MNRVFQKSVIVAILVLLISCGKNEPEPLLKNGISTEHYGVIPMNFYSSNPVNNSKIKPYKVDNIVWNDEYPMQIASIGRTGYDFLNNPYLSMGIVLVEYDLTKAEYSSRLRSLEIDLPFTIDDFSTQESFYNLIHEGNYNFASTEVDFGHFIIKYIIGDKIYSSINVYNSLYQIRLSDVVQLKPEFNSVPNGNNGLPASINATLTFSGLLGNEYGEFIYLKEVEIRGRFFRQAPLGNYWDDWGKGWNK